MHSNRRRKCVEQLVGVRSCVYPFHRTKGKKYICICAWLIEDREISIYIYLCVVMVRLGGIGSVTPRQSWKIFIFSRQKTKFFLRSVTKNFIPRNVRCLGTPLFVCVYAWLVTDQNKIHTYVYPSLSERKQYH